MRGSPDRSHLSIGEVLSLLQDEFPDVTISKIRFLESQGLLDPERTPSGYRKFYEDDIQRLRWILRQQKDHYLPLKVIKDRLDGRDLAPSEPVATLPAGERTGAGGSPPAGANGRRSTINGHAALAVDERPPGPSTAPGGPGVAAAAPPVAPGAPEHHRGEGGTPLDGRLDNAPSVGDLDAPPAASGPVDDVGATARDAGDSHSAARAVAAGLVADARSASTADDAAEDSAMPPAAPVPGRPTMTAGLVPGAPVPGPPGGPVFPGAPMPAGGAATAAGGAHEGPQPGSAAFDPGADVPGPPVGARDPLAAFTPEPGSPVSLTIDELAEVSGMTVRDLRDLERFGLLESHVVGDAAYYDADALVVARTAGGFLRHGIEARHLRSYKVAVDREAGLFEQIVLPLLKQRNPEAHRRAGRNLAELVHLGEVMRAVLLRRELRKHVEL
ncbi:MAG TPA: MerR family transcriptional regulator [Acidimicrobiales bacterium]|nr:MerR family transcriptional regulator [Acidimicrobiales bacterium]